MRRLTGLFVLLAVAAPALAADVGSITSEAGTVTLERASQTLKPAQGQTVDEGDVLNTGTDGRVELQLRDGTLLSLSANSRFRVVQYDYDDQGKRAGLGLFDLLAGGLRGLTGAISQRDHRVELNTPVGTAGIRGTEFTTEISDNSLDVAMLEGEGVYVRNPQGEQVELTQPNVISQTPFHRLDGGGYRVETPGKPRLLLDKELQHIHERVEWLDQKRARSLHALRARWDALRQAHREAVAARRARRAAARKTGHHWWHHAPAAPSATPPAAPVRGA